MWGLAIVVVFEHGRHRGTDPYQLKRIANEIAHHAHTVGMGQLDE